MLMFAFGKRANLAYDSGWAQSCHYLLAKKKGAKKKGAKNRRPEHQSIKINARAQFHFRYAARDQSTFSFAAPASVAAITTSLDGQWQNPPPQKFSFSELHDAASAGTFELWSTRPLRI